jgi:hypothetical protein
LTFKTIPNQPGGLILDTSIFKKKTSPTPPPPPPVLPLTSLNRSPNLTQPDPTFYRLQNIENVFFLVKSH